MRSAARAKWRTQVTHRFPLLHTSHNQFAAMFSRAVFSPACLVAGHRLLARGGAVSVNRVVAISTVRLIGTASQNRTIPEDNAASRAREKMNEAAGAAFDAGSRASEKGSEAAHRAGKAMDDAKDTWKEKASQARNYGSEKASRLSETAKDAASKAKLKAEEMDETYQVRCQ